MQSVLITIKQRFNLFNMRYSQNVFISKLKLYLSYVLYCEKIKRRKMQTNILFLVLLGKQS